MFRAGFRKAERADFFSWHFPGRLRSDQDSASKLHLGGEEMRMAR